MGISTGQISTGLAFGCILALTVPVLATKPASAATAQASSAATSQAGGLCLASNIDAVGTVPSSLHLSASQKANAKIIVQRGIANRIPLRGQVIAVAVAKQESGLINKRTGPARSRGLFRPSSGVAKSIYPLRAQATDKFYEQLMALSGWQTLQVADVSRQLARRPHAKNVARWESFATKAIAGLVGATPLRSASQSNAFGSGCNDGLAGFSTTEVPSCGFTGIRSNPVSCQDAMRRALAEVSAPSQNWRRLCLRFVTLDYGWNGGSPTAIHMWNNMPAQFKHATGTPPPGALLFWASGSTGHVALSLGSNMLISTDVLAPGKASLLSYATMQSTWGLTFLGWTPPNFYNGV